MKSYFLTPHPVSQTSVPLIVPVSQGQEPTFHQLRPLTHNPCGGLSFPEIYIFKKITIFTKNTKLFLENYNHHLIQKLFL